MTSALISAALAISAASPAHAAARAAWMKKLAAERNAALGEVSPTGNLREGHPGNPYTFCPKAAALTYVETVLLALMIKNKAHCVFPDSVIAELAGQARHNKTFTDIYCR